MANNHSSFIFLLLSFVMFLSNGSRKVEIAYGLEEKSMNLDQNRKIITLSSLPAENVCSTTAKDSKTSSRLQLANKYGACSNLKQGNTAAPSRSQVLLKDQARVKYLQSQKAGTSKTSTHKLATDEGASLTGYYGGGDYVIEVGLGTPKQTATLIFDTGSCLTWLQCLPCTDYCLPQEGAYFNPTDSTTYLNVACDSSACTEVLTATSAEVPCTIDCIYYIEYGDSSYSEGYLATDTLTLSNDVFLGYEFGCGEDQGGNFGGADGIIGLGNDSVSVVYQTSSVYGYYFSYCLPSTDSYTGYLSFGTDAVTTSSGYTPLLTNSDYPTFYYVGLTGIYVGGELLDVASTVYTAHGTIIDSGTTLTYLPITAYSALVTAFKDGMTAYPSVLPTEGLEGCYNLAGYASVTVPSIVFQLSGYDYSVPSSGILYQVTTDVYCLAFSSTPPGQFSIFGNTQQLTYEVSYNVAGEQLGFTANSCL